MAGWQSEKKKLKKKVFFNSPWVEVSPQPRNDCLDGARFSSAGNVSAHSCVDSRGTALDSGIEHPLSKHLLRVTILHAECWDGILEHMAHGEPRPYEHAPTRDGGGALLADVGLCRKKSKKKTRLHLFGLFVCKFHLHALGCLLPKADEFGGASIVADDSGIFILATVSMRKNGPLCLQLGGNVEPLEGFNVFSVLLCVCVCVCV